MVSSASGRSPGVGGCGDWVVGMGRGGGQNGHVGKVLWYIFLGVIIPRIIRLGREQA